MISTLFLFAVDLDGTLLPNTCKLPASGCLERTQRLLNCLRERGIPICFVTGRHLDSARKGVKTFGLTPPDWWICNVGTEIYNSEGERDIEWEQQLGPKLDHQALRKTLTKIPRLLTQELDKQGRYKFSLYYHKAASKELQAEIRYRVDALADNLKLVVSIEEGSGRALLDIIPIDAGKKHAVEYMAHCYRLAKARVFFAGDSGNDFDVLLSGICGTMVGNAPNDVQSRLRVLQTQFSEAQLYMANAHYGDGIIEGLHHYGFWSHPVTA
ncbi:HAD-IIB family hydrolase [Methylobacter sp.]|uniref:HAD-IIB family hydrolase n=1 Tax=Methylobacter sp. TaxID=2051955 RepID=UPI002FDE324F